MTAVELLMESILGKDFRKTCTDEQLNSFQKAKEMEAAQRKEPSDEEIIKASERENHYENSSYHRYNAFRDGWVSAIKWYREQLKQNL